LGSAENFAQRTSEKSSFPKSQAESEGTEIDDPEPSRAKAWPTWPGGECYPVVKFAVVAPARIAGVAIGFPPAHQARVRIGFSGDRWRPVTQSGPTKQDDQQCHHKRSGDGERFSTGGAQDSLAELLDTPWPALGASSAPPGVVRMRSTSVFISLTCW
jgi:hypothetical protein